ncbi:Pkinase-domain-containing protein [Piedraia hortae CBS 480.64]|uniref:non-specific serine/threonine protein kinase n=1 Tax=Piedraia hortae CBS 480.64 TaxID=1314780 RepID=A0A6A7BZP4_9PEZI|nr:Pkinase-domain-containing protein [Piedraia hortae CBS 480.64]
MPTDSDRHEGTDEKRWSLRISLPKTRSASNISSMGPARHGHSHLEQSLRERTSIDSVIGPDGCDGLKRLSILSGDATTGLSRIRPHQFAGKPTSASKLVSVTGPDEPRKASWNLPSSPTWPASEDIHRFPLESLHSFSFALQAGESLHTRQNVLRRSIDFMRDKIGWAASSPRIANAQAKLNGDEELLSIMELLQKANVPDLRSFGGGDGAEGGGDLGCGPLTGPAQMEFGNVFDRSFTPESAKQEGSSPLVASPVAVGRESPTPLDESDDPTPPRRTSLKRTFTDVAGYSLQHKLTEAMARPYQAEPPPRSASMTGLLSAWAPPLPRTGTASERAPHGHRNQTQAIFTTESAEPWTITAANDLACLIFGVTRAEVRKLGIMKVMDLRSRQWLEGKLCAGTVKPSPRRALGKGVTARLLAKPPAWQTYQSRRSRTENGIPTPPKEASRHSPRGRGVIICGDVVAIKKMNGSTGSASLWVKEKGDTLIWVVEEIAEDVAFITLDEIGSVVNGRGAVEAIWGMDRLRAGKDVTRLIPAFPRLEGTNTGALDYEAVARLRYFTAQTANSISIPATVEQLPGQNTIRVSSFPHIAGIIVVDPATMRISASNHAFSTALFGYDAPQDTPITKLIPAFDRVLQIMTEENNITLVDGIVIPEHSFRQARSTLALREGSADAAALFLRPSGLPAVHRDGRQIMVDVQMRVVESDWDPVCRENDIGEEIGNKLVYALWVTYSRQFHAVNHGVGSVNSAISRPGTPPRQPPPGTDMALPVVSEKPEDETVVGAEEDADGESEPFEHPAPEMIKAGVRRVARKQIEGFKILEEMGQGAYGQVKLVRYRVEGAKKMVIKYVTKRRILVDTWHRDRRLGTVPLEIHVLDYLRREGMQHPNIVEMVDFFEDDVNYYIEMVPHGLPGMDLFDYIELRMSMDEDECRRIFRQVVEAIWHLHVRAKVVHRDIKDENVILDGEGKVKLADFGSAAYIKSGPFDVFVGTIDYAAPEVLRGEPYRGKEQDVWALGILLYTIIYKENPFYSIDEIMDQDLRVPYVTSEACITLIRKMLDRDVARRIDIEGVLAHEWLNPPSSE